MAENAPKIEREGQWTILHFGDAMSQIGESNAEEARTLLLAATKVATGETPPNLLLDLSGVSFFGSSFIEGMYRAWKSVTDAGGKFGLADCSDHCQEVLQVTKLGDLWKTYKTRSEALSEQP